MNKANVTIKLFVVLVIAGAIIPYGYSAKIDADSVDDIPVELGSAKVNYTGSTAESAHGIAFKTTTSTQTTTFDIQNENAELTL